ncbi:MAG: ThiF family adenylyltransferase, partial [Ginsengibacter sp.]
MNEVYARNKIYITDTAQNILIHKKIYIAGCGIGSNIAECALRLGFENLTLVDGDRIELSNLNRQNYDFQHIGCYKTDSLLNRLLNINPAANVKTITKYLTLDNIGDSIRNHDIAINALDFQSETPFIFDKLCQEKYQIPVLHPYNLGWATLVFVLMPNGPDLSLISTDYMGFEKKIVSFLIEKLEYNEKVWVQDVLSEYEEKWQGQSPPQLSIGSWLAAGACTNIMYRLATQKPVRSFPD